MASIVLLYLLTVTVTVAVAMGASGAGECSLYLAPSLVRGGGKGIFVGTRVKVGKSVGSSEGLLLDDYLVQGE